MIGGVFFFVTLRKALGLSLAPNFIQDVRKPILSNSQVYLTVKLELIACVPRFLKVIL